MEKLHLLMHVINRLFMQLNDADMELTDYLKNIHEWGFDVMKLQKVPYPVLIVTFAAFKELQLQQKLNLNETKFQNFLISVSTGYHNNPYHNALHAADVTQSSFYLLCEANLISVFTLSPLSCAAILIAAAVHDIGHPGVNGKFLVNTMSDLALTYNDKSPLENMHVSKAFRLWTQESNDFTADLPKAQFRLMRKLIVDMVLATDAELHNSLMNKLELYHTGGDYTVHVQEAAATSDVPPENTGFILQVCVCLIDRIHVDHAFHACLRLPQVALHLADVSNPAKPWSQYMTWLDLLMKEFYAQGDKERELSMPISFAFDQLHPVADFQYQLVSNGDTVDLYVLCDVSSRLVSGFH